MANQVRLIIIQGSYKGKRFEFEDEKVVRFGRASDCHVRFEDDRRMSRYHCELEINFPHVQIYDLGSLHGTIVNKKKYGGRGGRQVKKASSERQSAPIVLQDGDKIQVGRNLIRIEIELDQAPFVDTINDAPTLFDQEPNQPIIPARPPAIQPTRQARQATQPRQRRQSAPQPAIQPRNQAYDPNKTIVEASPSPSRQAHPNHHAKTIVESPRAQRPNIHTAKTIVQSPANRTSPADHYAKTIVEPPNRPRQRAASHQAKTVVAGSPPAGRQRTSPNQAKTVVAGSAPAGRQRTSPNQAKTVVAGSAPARRQRTSQNQAKTVVAGSAPASKRRTSPNQDKAVIGQRASRLPAYDPDKTIVESNAASAHPPRHHPPPVNKASDKGSNNALDKTIISPPKQKPVARQATAPAHAVLTPEQQEARSALLELLRDLGLKALNRDPILASYVIEKRLGRGGFGKVFQARHRRTQERVALKIMRPRAAVNEYVRESFKREIDNTRALSHPNIVQLLEDGSVGNMFYFTMEYCDRGNANQLRRKRGGKIPLAEALPIMKQILHGLSFIHEQGYIHRDLKPDNILLTNTPNGVVAKIADLGLTKGFLETGMNGGLTITGIRIGTGPYMSREQLINFKYVEPVSDVWSLGATFYVMLTGKRPRQGPPNLKNHDLVLNGRIIPIRQFDSSIPLVIADVIDRSLVVDTNKRYETATEMLQALEQVT